MLVDRLLKSTPDDKVNLVQIRAILAGKNVWPSELNVLTLQVSVFLAV